MVAWICEMALEVIERLPERARRSLCAKIGLAENEVQMWRDMSHRMFVPFHDNGIISQFEGYEELEELDWEFYRAKYGNIQRLDRILRAEGDTPDRYKLSKQADALMLFFMFAERSYVGSSTDLATSTRPTLPVRTSPTTSPGPRTARR